MSLEPWRAALLVLGVGFHALAVLYTYWLGRKFADRGEPAEAPARRVRAGEVACPECGYANGREYRFCGNCVAELPSGGTVDRELPGSVGQGIG